MLCAPIFARRSGLDVVVLVSDTMGRPWRNGLTDVALGAAGIDPLRDYRGEQDAYGNELSLTQMSAIDELCGAAELVKGKYDQVPVAVIRGLGIVGTPDGPGAAVLVRSAETDMFSLGTAEARADGLRTAARVDEAGPPPPPTVGVDRAIEHAVRAAGPNVQWHRDGEQLVPQIEAGATAGALARAGAAVHALRCSLYADGYATTWLDNDGGGLGIVTVTSPGAR